MRINSRGIYKDVMDLYTHPYADKRGRVPLHRYLMEQKIGRYLLPFEAVHHIDGNEKNNSIENLALTNIKEHCSKYHPRVKKIISVVCAFCGRRFEKTKRKINGKKQFCSRSHSSAYYVPKRQKKEITHNTEMGYRRGCRCDLCKKAHAIRAVAYRSRKT